MGAIRVLIADDHLIIRDGIKLMLKKNREIKIVSEVSNGKEVIDYLENNPNTIDLVLMDINMPEMSGIEATEIVKERYDVEVLALSMHAEDTYISSMLKAGALGYILKESGVEELITAIKSVAAGQKYYSNEVSMTLISSLMNEEKKAVSPLSDRENEVLSHIASGATNNEVGAILCISGRTVETHRRNILAKLEVRNSAEMIRYAIEHNMVR